MPTIHAIIHKPVPPRVWESSAYERHYAFTVMQDLCPSLDTNRLLPLSFSVSFRFGAPMPANRHELHITGKDALVVKRLVPAFSPLAALSAPINFGTWYESLPASASALSVAPSSAASLPGAPCSASPLHTQTHPFSLPSATASACVFPSPSSPTRAVSPSPPSSPQHSGCSLSRVSDKSVAESKRSSASLSDQILSSHPSSLPPSLSSPAEPSIDSTSGWSTVSGSHRKSKRRKRKCDKLVSAVSSSKPRVFSIAFSDPDYARLRKQCIKFQRSYDPDRELVGLPDSHPFILANLQVHGFQVEPFVYPYDE